VVPTNSAAMSSIKLRDTLAHSATMIWRRSLRTLESKIYSTEYKSFSNILPLANITEFEFISLWNLNPKEYQEAISLIPSLHVYGEDKIKRVIEELIDKRK